MSPKRQGGFTLLEVLVAMAVLAIAMAALVKGGAENASNAAFLRDKTLAHWVGMNKVTELQLEPAWPSIGNTSGVVEMAGREWRWTAKVSGTPDADLRRVDVQVREEAQEEGSLDSLVAFLPRPPEKQVAQ